MKYLGAVLSVPVAVAISVGIGWLIHGSGLGNVLLYYVLGGSAVGIGVSLILSHEPLSSGRERGDYIERIARRDAWSAAFADTVMVLLVTSFVFALTQPTKAVAAFVPCLAALALIDASARERMLNKRYGS